ncbi:MarR family winged helix-turn-helix transcriptional regulator [Methanobacterium bryantii]|uniref:MarR family transcriptional regulator n=1 Tax=Methanobacterium bryantii TaxID=2161 RepID=A0A2A2H7M8_METBR|nr:MarR family transcriptional regulator [Methanobacterium bryantii]PAV05270.1 MarR family transcriptional regulator [Methanobacterium bryantii]
MNDEDIRIVTALFDVINNKLSKASQETLLKIYKNLTIAEASAIYAVGPEEPKTMKQIAETLGVAVSTPTRTIDRLLEKGFVNRKVGEKDRRKLLIELTPKGKKLLVDIDKENLEITKKMLNGLKDEEIEKFKEILFKISENIE